MRCPINRFILATFKMTTQILVLNILLWDCLCRASVDVYIHESALNWRGGNFSAIPWQEQITFDDNPQYLS
jgi:hypothetical protein